MDMITVGVDVSKDRLDVAICPSGEAFFVERDAAGLERLAARFATDCSAHCRVGGDRRL
jgi:transposase